MDLREDATAAAGHDDDLQRVVYASKTAPGASHPMLVDILKASRRNNRAHGITGVLVHFDGHFLQYLEGPAVAVHDTLALIRLDARHHDLEVLLDAPADGEGRVFRHWSMGRVEVGSEGWRRLVEADWPRIAPLAPERPSGVQVLRALARHPEDTLDREAVFGAGPGRAGRRDTDIAVVDPPPELLVARLNLAAAVVIAIALVVAMAYRWLG